jgi:hypothetical protein
MPLSGGFMGNGSRLLDDGLDTVILRSSGRRAS